MKKLESRPYMGSPMLMPNSSSGNYIAYAAGILPYARYKGVTMFLVGKDAQDGLWSDWGGKFESKDKSEMETAQREFQEETCGCVMDMKTLRVRMSLPSNYTILQSTTQAKHPYYMYLMEVPFDAHVRANFKRTVSFLRFCRLPKSMVEKVDMQWVTLSQLMALNLRTVFHSGLQKHKSALHALTVQCDASDSKEAAPGA